MKIILSTVVLLAILHHASAQIQPLDGRKHFQYTDTSFEVGEVKILIGLPYNFGDTAYAPQSISVLDSLADFLLMHPQLHIEIGSHTDNRGSDKYNLKLTEARASRDYYYLANKDVPYWQLAFKGYGKTLPIALNQINGKDYPEGQQQNRRTEVKIISILPPLKSLDTRKHFEYTDTSFKVGEVKIQCCIYFGFDGPGLRPESFPHLDSVLNFLYYYPELKVEVGNHTDSFGNDKYNLKLSQARSQNVVDYLVSKGVSPDRLIAKGYGETLPIAMNNIGGKDNPEGRYRNRRTELKLTAVDPAKENFSRPTLLNPQLSLIHFLFGEKASSFSISLFNARAIELIIDSHKQQDSTFNSEYRVFSRSYLGFINESGDSIVMATIDFSSHNETQNHSVFNSAGLDRSKVLFINLSKRICLKSF